MGLEGTQFSVNTVAELEVIICYKCAMPFAVPVQVKKTLRSSQDIFYCPQGHAQSYSKSTETILKEEYETKLRNLKFSHDLLVKENAKLKAKPGCPHCGKNVHYVDMHIKRMHPEIYLKNRK